MEPILAARSSFSIGESILSVERLVDSAVAVGAKAIALTDNMSITGLIDFTKQAKKREVQPIIGCRLRFVDNPAWRKTREDKKKPPFYYLTYYVLSEKGLKALFKLLTLANSEARFYSEAKLGFDDLFDALTTLSEEDVAITSGDMHSIVTHERASEILLCLKAALGPSNVFLTLNPIDTPLFDTCNKLAITLADELGLPTLVTRPVCYEEGDDEAAEIMGAIAANTDIYSTWHKTPAFRNLYPHDERSFAKEVIEAKKRLVKRGLDTKLVDEKFRKGMKATETLQALAKYQWEKAPISLPKLADDEYERVKELCLKGWRTRFQTPVFGHIPSADEQRDLYGPRLRYELQTLKNLGFSAYFLLVHDVVDFAKSSGILVGPGRGSVGGSLVAYLMGITECDPIRFGLIFERFINPDRIDLPDADLDIMSERRYEVIDYLTKKYGAERVSGISNYNSLGAASAIRDVSRMSKLPEAEYNCSKFAPKKHGAMIPLSEAANITAEIGKFRDKNPGIWKWCLTLEGAIKAMGRHAGGIVVGGCDLTERAVVERRKDGATVCWDKQIVEDQGLVKMDILGLINLDMIFLAQEYIFERHGKRLDLLAIPLDDPKVLESFAKGLTTAIFQFESGGMRRLLKELGKDGTITFDDISAAMALYRPGPMETGMMDDYWKRKQGLQTVEYDHPLMEKPLKPTYGVMVYQEQVMQVARDIAGYSMADADKLRKIMGKKLPEEMAKERGKFVDGCVATVSMDADEAAALFDKIEGFAGYGFNKSHSVEYSLISYQSMYLKTHYPVEFFAAALSLLKDDKLADILKDAKRFNIEINTPDINISTDRFEILTATKLSIPFNRVLGISGKACGAILTARKGGAFTSKADFEARVEKRACNSGKREVLDKVGAFARLEPSQPPADDPSRIKDQRELIPGLIAQAVPIDRELQRDPLTIRKLLRTVDAWREELITDGVCVRPHMGKNAKIMVVFDAPSSAEERFGQMARGGYAWEQTAHAMGEIGWSQGDLYVTSLLKRPKVSARAITARELAMHEPWLAEEIAILKPPVIVALGATTTRHFIPDLKGKASEQAGKIVYLNDIDANLIIGFSPGEIWHNPDRLSLLEEVFFQAMQLTDY
jgi:DNA polymerase-3 subunit alpha